MTFLISCSSSVVGYVSHCSISKFFFVFFVCFIYRKMNSNLRLANDYYQKSQETIGLSRPLKRSYLEKSVALYRIEMRNATQDNLPSLMKNFGLACYRLANLLNADDDLPLIIYNYCEAIQAFSTAWTMRPDQQNTEWGGRLEELISDCFEGSHRSCECDIFNVFMFNVSTIFGG